MFFKTNEELAVYLEANPKYLDIDNCPMITELSKLPDTLTHLWINNCPGITKLPELPKTLKKPYVYPRAQLAT